MYIYTWDSYYRPRETSAIRFDPVKNIKRILPLTLLIGAGFQAASAQEGPKVLVIEDGGVKREFVVATDEVASVDNRGRVTLTPASGSPNLAAMGTQAMSTGGEKTIVLYEKGAPRNEATRRLITKTILVEVRPGTNLHALAAAVGADYAKPAPVFADTHHIFNTRSAGEVLAVTDALRAQPGVVSATPLLGSRRNSRSSIPNDPYFPDQWHLRNVGLNGGLAGVDINVVNTWTTTKGSGVRIGILDDGMEVNHPDLRSNVDFENSYNWQTGTRDPSPVTEDNWHGTAVAGIAGARGNNGFGVSGVAPLARLVGLNLLGDTMTDMTEAEAFLHRQDIIQVKSNSWGPFDNGTLVEGPRSCSLIPGRDKS